MADDKILDLDDLFGAADPVQVRYQGKVYDLQRPSAFSPMQLMQWQKLQDEYRTALASISHKGKRTRTDDDAQMSAALEQIVNGSLTMICPEMNSVGIPFLTKLAALKYYNEQTASQAKASDAKNAKKKKRTGANSLRA